MDKANNQPKRFSGMHLEWGNDKVTLSKQGCMQTHVTSTEEAVHVFSRFADVVRVHKPAACYHNRTINGKYHQKQFESVVLHLEPFNDDWLDQSASTSGGSFYPVLDKVLA